MGSLCVSLFGEADERMALERRVKGIFDRHSEFKREPSNEGKNRRRRLSRALQKANEKIASVANKMRALHKSETEPVRIAGYSGTAASIAAQVAEEKNSLGWMRDPIPLGAECPLSGGDFEKVLGILRRLSPERRREVSLRIPVELPEVDALRSAIAVEEGIAKDKEAARARLGDGAPLVPTNADPAAVERASKEARGFEGAWRALGLDEGGWRFNAAKAVLGGVEVDSWRRLLTRSREAIESAQAACAASGGKPKAIDSLRVEGGADESDLPYHASLLARSGGEGVIDMLRTLFNRDVWNARRALRGVSLGGARCKTRGQLEALVAALRARADIAAAAAEWAPHAGDMPEARSAQAERIDSLHGVLEKIFALSERRDGCASAMEELSPGADIDWMSAVGRERVEASCEIFRLGERSSENGRYFDEVKKPVSGTVAGGGHPVAAAILEAIEKRDCDAFARLRAEAMHLARDAEEWGWASSRLNELGEIAPLLREDLVASAGEDIWNERAERLKEAWAWAQAKEELDRRLREDTLPLLEEQHRDAVKGYGKALRALALDRAWNLCLKRFDTERGEEQRKHLLLWLDAVRKLGKGTGPNAPVHRDTAKEHLKECRGIIPALVMPMSRVWDTVPFGERGIFDVVIADEASQCSYESILLFHLGKKVLIVGDDKQTSPEDVGVKLEDVVRLQEKYLRDFKYRALFDGQASLFGLGRFFHGGDITLREHFRCMPEIIEFSNRLWYSPPGLIPMRQFGSDRLPPLATTFVGKGFVNGVGQSVVNIPEAEAIAEEIVGLSQDPRFEGKSVGVITLQGQRQAAEIWDLLSERFSPREVARMKLRCGRPYDFQGDERDLIFLSMVASPNGEGGEERRMGALIGKFDEQRFNVATSRARDRMHLFHSVSATDLHPECLRRKLLEYMHNPETVVLAGMPLHEMEKVLREVLDKREQRPPEPFESWFELEVAVEIARRGFSVKPQHEVAYKRIDLAVVGGGSLLAVECDGDHWHGPEQYDEDMRRQRMLERCGWHFFRVRESLFRTDREKALAGLWPLLDELGIRPLQGAPRPGEEKPSE